MTKLFTIDQYTLFTKTRVIAKTIPEKAIIPAHEYIHIKSEGNDEIVISAQNSENSTSVTIDEVIFEEPFDIAIEYSFLKPLKKVEVLLTFALDGNRCVITCHNSRWEVPIMDPKDLPVMRYKFEPLFEIEAIKLKEVLEAVSPFAYNNEQTAISKISFKNTENYLSIGASSHFSCCEFRFDIKLKREIAFLMSRDTANLVASIADENKFYIYLGEDHAMQFQTSFGIVSSIGHYFENNPVNNYQELLTRFIDREHDVIKIADKSYFKEQVNKATAFSPANKRMLSVDILDNKLHLQVEDFMAGRKSEQDVDVLLEKVGSASMFIVPYDHLMKVITTSPSLGFDIQIPRTNGDGMSCIKGPLVIQDSGFTYLIMPSTN